MGRGNKKRQGTTTSTKNVVLILEGKLLHAALLKRRFVFGGILLRIFLVSREKSGKFCVNFMDEQIWKKYPELVLN